MSEEKELSVEEKRKAQFKANQPKRYSLDSVADSLSQSAQPAAQVIQPTVIQEPIVEAAPAIEASPVVVQVTQVKEANPSKRGRPEKKVVSEKTDSGYTVVPIHVPNHLYGQLFDLACDEMKITRKRSSPTKLIEKAYLDKYFKGVK